MTVKFAGEPKQTEAFPLIVALSGGTTCTSANDAFVFPAPQLLETLARVYVVEEDGETEIV